MYFIPEKTQLIFWGLNINNKLCSTFTFMYLVQNSRSNFRIYLMNKANGRIFWEMKKMIVEISKTICEEKSTNNFAKRLLWSYFWILSIMLFC